MSEAASGTATNSDRQRYVMTNRRAGLRQRAAQIDSRNSMSAAFSTLKTANIVSEFAPEDLASRRVVVFEASQNEVADERDRLPQDAILEPEIHHWPVKIPSHLAPHEISHKRSALPLAALPNLTQGFKLVVQGNGKPLLGAEVEFYLAGAAAGPASTQSITDASGVANTMIPVGASVVAAVVTPHGGFWTMVAMAPAQGATVECKALPGREVGAWWQSALNVLQDANDPRGQGVKVGIVGTGLGAHPYLAHAVGIGSFIDGKRTDGTQAALDILSHDTHCAGIIGARSSDGGGYEGIARNCELFAARVFAEGKPANQGDIAASIDVLSKERHCHFINLSLGATTSSEIEEDAILDAWDHGTLCFGAAGNAGGGLLYPAAYNNVVAVSALGMKGWAPDGTLAATRVPVDAIRFGQDGIFLANFSSFGDRLRCSAPGVGILSTLPDKPDSTGAFGAMDGTSQACPSALASLAVLVSRDQDWMQLPGDATRCDRALEILDTHCRNVGLRASYQGKGMPYLPSVVVQGAEV